MNNSPIVSALIPFYIADEKIRQTVDSVLARAY
jgi:hypothetical protein